MRGRGRGERVQGRDISRGQKRRHEQRRGRTGDGNVDGEGDRAGTRTGWRSTKERKVRTITENEGQERDRWTRGEYAQGDPEELWT